MMPMNEIIASAERFTKTTMPGPNLNARERFVQGQAERGDNSVDAAVAKAAMTAAEERNAAAIIVLTSQGILVSIHSSHLINCHRKRIKSSHLILIPFHAATIDCFVPTECSNLGILP